MHDAAHTSTVHRSPSWRHLLRVGVKVGVAIAWLACLCAAPTAHAQSQRRAVGASERSTAHGVSAPSTDRRNDRRNDRWNGQGARSAGQSPRSQSAVRARDAAARASQGAGPSTAGPAVRAESPTARGQVGTMSRGGGDDARAALDSRTRREPRVSGPAFPKHQRYTIPRGPYAQGQAYEKRSLRSNAVGKRSKAVGIRVNSAGIRAMSTTAQFTQHRQRTFHAREYYPGERIKEPTITIVKRERRNPLNRGAFTPDLPPAYACRSVDWRPIRLHLPITLVLGTQPIRTFEDLRRRSDEIGEYLRRQRQDDIVRWRGAMSGRPQRVVDHTGENRPPQRARPDKR